MIIAQGKAAEAAALGKTPPTTNLFFPIGLARLGRAKQNWEKESESFCVRSPGAALVPRLPRATISSSLQDFSWLAPLSFGLKVEHPRLTAMECSGRNRDVIARSGACACSWNASSNLV